MQQRPQPSVPPARALHPVLRLALLARRPGRRAGAEGAIMAIVLLVAIGVPLAALAAAQLISSGNLRAGLMGQSREARDAAEDGILAVVTELNKVENRRLLVTDSSRWSQSDINLCALSAMSGASPVTPSTRLAPTDPSKVNSGNIWGRTDLEPATSSAGGVTLRRYQLIRVQALNPSRQAYVVRERETNSAMEKTAVITGSYNPNTINIYAPDKTTAKRDNIGYIRLTVEGQIYKSTDVNATPVARATVTREFQVAPKCCSNSFGPIQKPDGTPEPGVFGADPRQCPPTNKSDPLGVVSFGGAIAYNNGDSANVYGYDVNNPANHLRARVLCVPNGIALACPAIGWWTNKGLKPYLGGNTDKAFLVDAQLDLNDPPLEATGITANSIPLGKNDKTKVFSLPNTTYCKYVQNAPKYYEVSLPNVPPSAESAWHCVINNIDLKGGLVINIYSDAPTATASAPKSVLGASAPVRIWILGDFSVPATSGISHYACGPNCATPVTAGDAFGPKRKFNDLHFYGKPRATAATASWSFGGNGTSLAAFINAPAANCSLSGGGQYLGKIWCRKYEGNGNFTIITAPASTSTSFYDYVARSAWGARLFGRN